jgi:UDP-N-acetylmuramoyl-tripeptide--D-alanyl-D-alanine ligase
VPDVDAAVEVLSAGLRPGDVVLVKASKSAHLEHVTAALLAGEEPAQAPGTGSGVLA